MKLSSIILAGICLLLISGCTKEMQEAIGFSLPEGDPELGKVVYRTMECSSCHVIPGIEQSTSYEEQDISVTLGGKVTRIKTYGELLTSVINPSHRIAQVYEPQNTDSEGNSAMLNYNDVMTVSQLIDLVSFLQDQYELKPYEASDYHAYYP